MGALEALGKIQYLLMIKKTLNQLHVEGNVRQHINGHTTHDQHNTHYGIMGKSWKLLWSEQNHDTHSITLV